VALPRSAMANALGGSFQEGEIRTLPPPAMQNLRFLIIQYRTSPENETETLHDVQKDHPRLALQFLNVRIIPDGNL
jgi:hypothetical protein